MQLHLCFSHLSSRRPVRLCLSFPPLLPSFMASSHFQLFSSPSPSTVVKPIIFIYLFFFLPSLNPCSAVSALIYRDRARVDGPRTARLKALRRCDLRGRNQEFIVPCEKIYIYIYMCRMFSSGRAKRAPPTPPKKNIKSSQTPLCPHPLP